MGYEVDFLPVGEGGRSGDAIVLRFGNLHGPRSEQRVVVVDGGFQQTGEDLIRHLWEHYRTDTVDVVISTHPDADHTAGLHVVLENAKVGCLAMHLPWEHTEDIARLFRDGRVTDNSVRESLRRSLEDARSLEALARRKNIPIVEPFAGVGGFDRAIRILGPSKEYYESLLPHFRGTPEPHSSLLSKAVSAVGEALGRVAESWGFETLGDDGETSPENNSSAIVLIADNSRHILLTGDAGIPALTQVADRLDAESFDYATLTFIQVPHHGSRRNVGPTILNRLLGPKCAEPAKLRTAFVSSAKEGEPKHPAKKVTNAFLRRGAPVHATQGSTKRHHREAPPREGYIASTPLPFFNEVDE